MSSYMSIRCDECDLLGDSHTYKAGVARKLREVLAVRHGWRVRKAGKGRDLCPGCQPKRGGR